MCHASRGKYVPHSLPVIKGSVVPWVNKKMGSMQESQKRTNSWPRFTFDQPAFQHFRPKGVKRLNIR